LSLWLIYLFIFPAPFFLFSFHYIFITHHILLIRPLRVPPVHRKHHAFGLSRS
jgi:hypothetical protein